MERWEWDENAMREALISLELVPSYFISGAVWQRPSNGSGGRPRAGATSVYELMYLTSFHATGALDGFFDNCAREPDAFENNGEVFEVGGVGVERSRVSLAEVLERGVVVMAELERFEDAHQTLQAVNNDKPLSKRERDTLLTIIAVLCKVAKLDPLRHSKTAEYIEGVAAQMGISIGETTIEGHLKKIPDAVAGRMK